MTLTKRHRGALIVAVIVALVIGSEVALELYYRGEALVVVENLGAEPVEGLTLINGTERVEFGKISAGGQAKIYLAGKGENTLRLEFRQRGNALTNYQLPGFAASQMYREGYKLRVRLRSNEVERFQEESEPATPLGRVAHSFWKRFTNYLESEYKGLNGPP